MSGVRSLLERSLEKRALCRTGYPSYRTYQCSAFSRWGRWVLAGILIFVAVVAIIIFLFISMRRRRRRNRYASNNTPMTAPNQGYNAAGANQGYSNGGAPQQYGQTGGYGANQYAPPPGPPPPTYGGYK